jgi:hypothetical protein
MQRLPKAVFRGFTLLAACATAAGCSQNSQAPYKPIDAETVAAYEKIGAEHGGWAKKGYPNFITAKRLAEEDKGKKHEIAVPGFHFKEFPKAKLPEVAVPFGLISCTHRLPTRT